jgi:hypothetical protein
MICNAKTRLDQYSTVPPYTMYLHLALWNPWPVEITGQTMGPTGENIWLNQEKYLVCQVFFGQTGNSTPGIDPEKTTCKMSAIPGWV